MATLTTTITEALTLNGSEQGGTITKSITGVNNVFKRIVTIAAGNDTTIASFHSDQHDDDGTIDVEQVKYMRITNLDSTNPVNLSFQIDAGEDDTAADESATLLLEAGMTFVMGGVDDAFATKDDGATIELTMHPLESVLVDSGSNAVQIEVLIATT